MQYKVLFVDWDGTLCNSRFWDRWRGTDKYNVIQQVLFEDRKDLLYAWMIGSIPYASVIKYVEEQTGIPYDALKAELIFSASTMEFIDPEISKYVLALRKKGIKVVIATDNMDTFREYTIPSLHLYELFDEILVSDTIGALKTEFYEDGRSKFFDEYLHEHGLSKHEALLIDNSLDVKVVENVGIDFAYVHEDMSLANHLRRLLV